MRLEKALCVIKETLAVIHSSLTPIGLAFSLDCLGALTPAYVFLIGSYRKVMLLFSMEDRPSLLFSTVIDRKPLPIPRFCTLKITGYRLHLVMPGAIVIC